MDVNRPQHSTPFSETGYPITADQGEWINVTQSIPDFISSLPFHKKSGYLKIIRELYNDMRDSTNCEEGDFVMTPTVQKRIRSLFFRSYYLMKKAQAKSPNQIITPCFSFNTDPSNTSPDLKVKAWELEFFYHLSSCVLNDTLGDDNKSFFYPQTDDVIPPYTTNNITTTHTITSTTNITNTNISIDNNLSSITNENNINNLNNTFPIMNSPDSLTGTLFTDRTDASLNLNPFHSHMPDLNTVSLYDTTTNNNNDNIYLGNNSEYIQSHHSYHNHHMNTNTTSISISNTTLQSDVTNHAFTSANASDYNYPWNTLGAVGSNTTTTTTNNNNNMNCYPNNMNNNLMSISSQTPPSSSSTSNIPVPMIPILNTPTPIMKSNIAISNPKPLRASIFSTITNYFSSRTISPGLVVPETNRHSSPLIALSARISPEMGIIYPTIGANISGNNDRNSGLISPNIHHHMHTHVHHYHIPRSNHTSPTDPTISTQIQPTSSSGVGSTPASGVLLSANPPEGTTKPPLDYQKLVDSYAQIRAMYNDMHQNPDFTLDSVSPFLGEHPSQQSRNFDRNTSSSSTTSSSQLKHSVNSAAKRELLRQLLVAVPCFFTMPIPTKLNTIAEITESLQLYAWIMPYIIACLPVKPLYEHLTTLTPFFSHPHEDHSHTNMLFSRTRTQQSAGAAGIGSSHVPNTRTDGLMLCSWIYLGYFYISKDPSNNTWEYRQLFLSDNYLYESYESTYKLMGYVPLSNAIITNTTCYFPYEAYSHLYSKATVGDDMVSHSSAASMASHTASYIPFSSAYPINPMGPSSSGTSTTMSAGQYPLLPLSSPSPLLSSGPPLSSVMRSPRNLNITRPPTSNSQGSNESPEGSTPSPALSSQQTIHSMNSMVPHPSVSHALTYSNKSDIDVDIDHKIISHPTTYTTLTANHLIDDSAIIKPVGIRKTQSDSAFNRSQPLLNHLHTSTSAAPSPQPHNTNCVSISCLIDSKEDSHRQSFYLFPACCLYIDRNNSTSYPTNTNNINSSTYSGNHTSSSIKLSYDTNKVTEQDIILLLLERILFQASIMTVEDKYVIPTLYDKFNQTLLGRGRYSEVRMAIRKKFIHPTESTYIDYINKYQNILTTTTVITNTMIGIDTSDTNIIEMSQQIIDTSSPTTHKQSYDTRRLMDKEISYSTTTPTGVHNQDSTTPRINEMMTTINMRTINISKLLDNIYNNPNMILYHYDDIDEHQLLSTIQTQTQSYLPEGMRSPNSAEYSSYIPPLIQPSIILKNLPYYPESCALKLVSKEVFWTRVQMGKERADSLVREVLSQTIVSQAGQRIYRYQEKLDSGTFSLPSSSYAVYNMNTVLKSARKFTPSPSLEKALSSTPSPQASTPPLQSTSLNTTTTQPQRLNPSPPLNMTTTASRPYSTPPLYPTTKNISPPITMNTSSPPLTSTQTSIYSNSNASTLKPSPNLLNSYPNNTSSSTTTAAAGEPTSSNNNNNNNNTFSSSTTTNNTTASSSSTSPSSSIHIPICEIYGMFETVDGFGLELEMMQHLNLFERLYTEGPFPELYVKQIITQLVDAVELCQSVGIAHRDIKLSNITYPYPKYTPNQLSQPIPTLGGGSSLQGGGGGGGYSSSHVGWGGGGGGYESMSRVSSYVSITTHRTPSPRMSNSSTPGLMHSPDGYNIPYNYYTDTRNNSQYGGGISTNTMTPMVPMVPMNAMKASSYDHDYDTRSVSTDSWVHSDASVTASDIYQTQQQNYHTQGHTTHISPPPPHTNTMKIKLADFGMAGFISKDGLLRGRCGTPGYVAPDIFNAGVHEGYPLNIDMFSVGVVAYILLCGHEPFYGQDDQELIQANKSVHYTFHDIDWQYISLEAKDFIRQVLTKSATDRLTPSQAKLHPWLHSSVSSST